MGRHRVGLWLVGAFGGVGTTITLGLSAMARGLTDRTALVTELPMFRGQSLAEPGEFVVGGHEIRETTFRESAEELRQHVGRLLGRLDRGVRPGSGRGLGAGAAGDERRGRAGRRPAGELGRRRAAGRRARPWIGSPPTWPHSSRPSRSAT